MCIYSKDSTPRTAVRPIRCMKVVRKGVRRKGKPVYYSLYTFIPTVSYIPGSTATMIEQKGEEGMFLFEHPKYTNLTPEFYSKQGIISVFKVEHGLCAYSKDAVGLRKLYLWAEDYFNRDGRITDIAIIECEIPANTRYLTGVVDLDGEGTAYAAEKLRVIREVPFDEIR